jgi:hypothetical protein
LSSSVLDADTGNNIGASRCLPQSFQANSGIVSRLGYWLFLQTLFQSVFISHCTIRFYTAQRLRPSQNTHLQTGWLRVTQAIRFRLNVCICAMVL